MRARTLLGLISLYRSAMHDRAPNSHRSLAAECPPHTVANGAARQLRGGDDANRRTRILQSDSYTGHTDAQTESSTHLCSRPLTNSNSTRGSRRLRSSPAHSVFVCGNPRESKCAQSGRHGNGRPSLEGCQLSNVASVAACARNLEHACENN